MLEGWMTLWRPDPFYACTGFMSPMVSTIFTDMCQSQVVIHLFDCCVWWCEDRDKGRATLSLSAGIATLGFGAIH
jgi:hypothetical protein